MTIASADMIVWLMPTTVVRRAIGMSTFSSFCRPVEPRLSAASTVVAGTSRMPWAVSRTTGGVA